MALSIERVEDWLGRPLIGSDGERIGKLDDLIFTSSGAPLFAAVSTGLFGRKTSLVPLADAGLTPDHVSVPYTKDQVKNAPQLDDPADMSGEIEAASAEHYGLPARRHGAGESYLSASERAREVERTQAAEAHARELEQRAGDLGREAEAAETRASEERQRADTSAREHQAALAAAQQARQTRQQL